MAKILVLFAHPRLESSRINAQLIKGLSEIKEVTFHDLYELYPDYDVNIRYEQELALENDIIVWHHPLYWYSCPALLKQWIDLVLEHGWAYGKHGTKLSGKKAFNVITSGGRWESYQRTGMHKHTILDFMAPFQQTAELCRMIYYPPFVVHGTHILGDNELRDYNKDYLQILQMLANDEVDETSVLSLNYLNDLLRK